MKAAVIEKPNVLVVKDVPKPTFGDYECLCQMLFGATCTGTDQHLIGNTFPWGVKYPSILGHESIGRVIEVGKKVRNLKVGDLVTRVGTKAVEGYNISWGGFAEYGVAGDYRAMKQDGLPADSWNGYRVNQVLAAGTDPAAATMFITWRETFSCISRMKFAAGQNLLVIGSGGNGLSFAAHGANLGAKCVAVAGAPARQAAATAAGATCYFDYKTDKLGAAIAQACPEGFDLIVDAVGKNGLLDGVLGNVKDGGAITIYGIDEFYSYRINPRAARGSFTFLNKGYDEEESHEAVAAMFAAGKLKADIWLTNIKNPYPLDRINDAFQAVHDRKAIKAVVKLS